MKNFVFDIPVMFLKLFDSLTPLDQILLKCIAVLGETIDRNLVETLMDRTPIRDIGSCKYN